MINILVMLFYLLLAQGNVSQLGWTTDDSIHLYHPSDGTEVVMPFERPSDGFTRVIEGRYLVSSGETSISVFDSVNQTSCSADYVMAVSDRIYITEIDEQMSLSEIDFSTCGWTLLVNLPDSEKPDRVVANVVDHTIAFAVQYPGASFAYVFDQQNNTLQTLPVEPLWQPVMITVSPDQRYALYGGSEHSYLYTPETGAIETLDGFRYFADKMPYVVSSSMGHFTLWQFEDGEIGELLFDGQNLAYDHLSRFSPSEHYAVYRSEETNYHFHIVDLANPDQHWVIELDAGFPEAWSADEQIILFQEQNNWNLYTYDLETGTLNVIVAAPANWLGFIDNDHALAVRENEYWIFNVREHAGGGLVYMRAEYDDEVITQHLLSPDKRYLIISQYRYNPDDGGSVCGTLLDLVEKSTTDLDCSEGEREFFWFAS